MFTNTKHETRTKQYKNTLNAVSPNNTFGLYPYIKINNIHITSSST